MSPIKPASFKFTGLKDCDIIYHSATDGNIVKQITKGFLFDVKMLCLIVLQLGNRRQGTDRPGRLGLLSWREDFHR